MKVVLFLLRFIVLVAFWVVLGTVADFTWTMWQTWVIIFVIALYSALGRLED